jgi:heat shock protein HtpX
MNAAPRPSLFGRALLALLLTIGFYGLALLTALGLLFLIYLEVVLLQTINVRLTLLALFGAVVILWSIFPRIDRFVAPGPTLTRKKYPHLFSEIEAISKATGQEMPRDVYLIPDVNAFVAERGGFMGIGSKRVMGIGLPLLHLVTVDEFKAVLAHEFGHFYGGDTSLGPWIYKTRAAIVRTVMNVGQTNRLLMIPFEAYARMFLRVTNAISRQQEYSADQLAARTVGAGAIISGLQKIHKYGQAFSAFFRQEYLPVVEAGYRPPLLDGFEIFLKSPRITQAVNQYYEQELTEGKTDPYDSHPSLKERIAALQNLPTGMVMNGSPASVLLTGSDNLEYQVLNHILVKKAKALKEITWEDVAETAFVPQWEKSMQPYRQLFKGLTPVNLYEQTRNIPDLFAKIARSGKFLPSNVKPSQVPLNTQVQVINNVIGCTVASALRTNGWKIMTSPGEAIVFMKDDCELQPFNLIPYLVGDNTTRAQWLEFCYGHKIDSLQLVS